MSEKSIRLDKWLWFARVVKSRTLAQKLVRSGKIRVNREKPANPAKLVVAGDVLTITLERRILVFKIIACGKRRGPFVEACKLYEDLAPVPKSNASSTSITSEQLTERVPRPDKQDRRKLLRLKNRQYFQ